MPGKLVLERRLFTSARGLLAGVLLFLAYFPLDHVVRSWLYVSAVATPEEWRQVYPGFALRALAGVVPATFDPVRQDAFFRSVQRRVKHPALAERMPAGFRSVRASGDQRATPAGR